MISTFRTLPAAETLANLPALPDAQVVDDLLLEELRQFKHKIIVLDDDPTGVQTVHGVSVYTDWTVESIEAGFKEEQPMFFILTNSRGFTSEETRQVHEDIAATIQQVSDQLHQPFILISRGDSTLRGHYPLETEVLRQTLEQQSNRYHDGEIIMPFSKKAVVTRSKMSITFLKKRHWSPLVKPSSPRIERSATLRHIWANGPKKNQMVCSRQTMSFPYLLRICDS